MLGIKVGDRFELNEGLRARLIIADDKKVILEDEDNTATALPMSLDEFRKKLNQKQITPIQEILSRVPLTDYQKKERDVRIKYIHTLSELVHDHGVKPTSRDAYQALIQEVEKRFPETQSLNPTTGKKNHPAKSTLARYWRAWVDSAFDDDALAPAKRHCTKRVDPASEAVMTDYLSNSWSFGSSKHNGGHYNGYKEAIKMIDKPDIHTVSERTFRRRLNDLKVFEKRYNNANNAERIKLNQDYTKKYRQQFALQRVEMDRVDLNLCLIDDETGKATEKVSLLVAMDCYSRYPLGVVMELGQAENKENVANLMAHMFLHDDKLPAFGKPTNLIIDNGSGFRNTTITKLATALGINLINAPVNTPAAKPFVESFFNVLRRTFFESWVMVDDSGQTHVGIPGYAKKRKPNSPSINLKKEARLTVSQFKQQLHLFMQEYCHKQHSQTHISPADAWRLSLQKTPVTMLDYEDVFMKFHVFSKQVTNQLQPRGYVTLNSQTYASTELKQLYNEIHLNKNRGQNPAVTIKYFPFDARYITVVAPIPNSPIVREVVVPNRNLEDMSSPISFDELAGLPPKSFGIYSDEGLESTGKFVGPIDKLSKPKQSRRTPRSGTPAASFEKNNALNLDVEQRIQQSNDSEQALDREMDANIAVNDLASQAPVRKRQKPQSKNKQHQNTTNDDNEDHGTACNARHESNAA